MRFRWKFFVLLCLLGAAGFLISGAPQPIDQVTRSYPALGQYLIFLFWLSGMIGWGELLARRLLDAPEPSIRPSTAWVYRLSLGSFAATFFVGTVSLLLPYGVFAKVWASFCVTLGIAVLATRPPLQVWASFKSSGRWAKVLITILFVALFVRTLEAYRMIRHGDQYAVYLTGPRLWFDAHGFGPFIDNPLQFLTSTWDYLSMWGNFFLAGAPGVGLDGPQRFAQWTTVSVGYAGLMVALYSVFSETIFEKSPGEISKAEVAPSWILLACLAAISIPSLNWTATLVKSDMGVCFWSITALLFLFRGSREKFSAKGAFTGGLLLGAAVMAKPSAVVFAFFAAFLSVVRIASEQKPRAVLTALQAVGWITVGGLLAASPVLARNTFLTTNPFYPWLGSLFPSHLMGPTLTQGFGIPTARHFELNLATYWGYLFEVLRDQPFNAASLLALIPILSSRVLKIPNRLSWFAAIGWLSALAFDWKLRPATELRYLGPALPLLAGLGILSAGFAVHSLARALRREWLVPTAGVILAVFLIATSKIPLHVLKKIPNGYFVPAARDVLDHDGGRAKQWMRQNVRNHDLILALSDNYFYYTLGLNYVEMQHSKPMDEVFSPATDGRKMIHLMEDFHARYFHHLKGIGGPLKPVLEPLSKCLVFEDSQARIYDVPCLVKEVR